MPNQIFTLATNNFYAKSALVLNRTIKSSKTTATTCCLIPKKNSNPLFQIDQVLVEKLEEKFDKVFYVDLILSNNEVELKLNNRPELNITFTKLHCFKTSNFPTSSSGTPNLGLFIDADCLVQENLDSVFDTFNSQRNQSFNLAAAPEFAWPDTFNSGVFLFRPSNEIFQGLVNALPSYDGGDQGILNAYFGQNWARLSVNYNLPISRVENLINNSETYGISSSIKTFGQSPKIIHFIGNQNNKPWVKSTNDSTNMTHYKKVWNQILHDELLISAPQFSTHMNRRLSSSVNVNLQRPTTSSDMIVQNILNQL